MRNLLLVCFVCLFSSLAFPSQDSLKNNMLDTVSVEAERYLSDNSLYSGVTPLTISANQLQTKQNGSLADLLAQNTSLFIKENGKGMLSTIAMRGTSASHTLVNWEGVSVNSHTMGQADFSQLPIFFFDEVAVYPGGESATHGNGAIGGVVNVSSLPVEDNVKVEALSSFGAFNTMFHGARVSARNEKISSKTSLFYRCSDNDFKFTYRDQQFRQKNASFYDYGFFEDFGIRINQNQNLSVKLWHTYYDRNIQPMVQMNDDSSKYESISNSSSRVIVDYVNDLPFRIHAKLGWLADKQLYQNHKIATQDLFFQASVERLWKSKKDFSAQLKLGDETHYIKPEVYAYLENVEEWRNSLYLLSKLQLTNRCALISNLRKEFVTNFKVPFSPSFNLNYDVVKRENHRLNVGAQFSRNIHVPTLNDKYWGRIDNRDLRVEKGADMELQLKYLFSKTTETNRINAGWNASAYYNQVTDWIMWLPRGNVWKPVNLDEVLARGFETDVFFNLSQTRTDYSLRLNYSYNRTEMVAGFANMQPFIGRQMPLLPKHTLSGSFEGRFLQLSYGLQMKYVGERSTTDVFDVMDHYVLCNLSVDYTFLIKHSHSVTLGGVWENIFQREYQTMPYRAMPKQNFSIFAKYKFKNNK